MYNGNDEVKKDHSMAHYHDLRQEYAKQMEYHGCGFALFQPISARDMTPPCAGYFDRNGDWNLICNLSTSYVEQKPLHLPEDAPAPPFEPLKYEPTQTSKINIEWQPKTSQNVEAHVLDGGAHTPDNLPAGADIQIKYASKSKFGAVLMTLRPISLQAYNDERLFMDWLQKNRALLYATWGAELKKYGLWIVTRTYTAPGCSINAWMDANKSSTVGLKAKANMLGELADGQMQWSDKIADKDWSHYKAKQGDGLVVFMDGIEISKSEWWVEAFKKSIGRSSPSRSPSLSGRRRSSVTPPRLKSPPQFSSTSDFLAPPRHMSASDHHTSQSTPDIGRGRRLSDSQYMTQSTPSASIEVGVMPTWCEDTAGPVTHGGTQNAEPTGDGGYLVGSPQQKQEARHESGFAGMFTKGPSPQPYDGMGSKSSTWNTQIAKDASPFDVQSPVEPPTPTSPVDNDVLKDAGMSSLNRRSVSIRTPSNGSTRAPSIAPSIVDSIRSTSTLGRSKSLRKETRGIHGKTLRDHPRSASPPTNRQGG